MRLELTGRHIDITPTLRRLVDTRLEKLERLLNNSAVSAQVVLTREKNRLQADITLHARGERFLHGVGTANAWATALSQAAAKISQQARKVKGKWEERKRRGLMPTPAADAARGAAPPAEQAGTARRRDRMPKVFHSTRQAVRPMSVADAVREIDARRADLIVFRDPERVSISVMYRRGNGELTLVETEVDA